MNFGQSANFLGGIFISIKNVSNIYTVGCLLHIYVYLSFLIL
jgi:hypothetical protein